MTEKTFDAGEIFSGKTSGTPVMGWDQPSPQTPVSNPDFILSDWHGDIILWACHMSRLPIYIYGPTGCGKSSILREIAARLNWPVYEVTGHEQLQAVDLAGHMALDGTRTVWQDGPLVSAMRNGGLFLFNELDAALPSATVALNTILDGAPLCLENDAREVIRPHPMFRFAATGNTSGNGDEQGSYTGTSRQNIALLDRFYTCRGGYPSPEVEATLLKRAAPSLPAQALQYMQAVADATRAVQGPDARLVTTPISTRTLVLWAQLAERFAPLRGKMVYNPATGQKEKCNVLGKALDHAIGFKRSEAERNALHEIMQRITGIEGYPDPRAA